MASIERIGFGDSPGPKKGRNMRSQREHRQPTVIDWRLPHLALAAHSKCPALQIKRYFRSG